MLEILFLIWFTKHLAGVARNKHRSGGWGALGPIGWVGGEIGGAILGASNGSEGMGLYGWAILGGASGAVLAFATVSFLSTLPPPGFPTARVV